MAQLWPAALIVASGPRAPLDPDYKIDPRDHLKFARMIARVVRALPRFNFLPGSAEEKDLEAVAYASLCAHARRFDPSRRTHGTPANLFQGWAKRGIWKECVRAAEKILKRGLTALPSEQPTRCLTSAEFLQPADERSWYEDEESEPEPFTLAPREEARRVLQGGKWVYVVGHAPDERMGED